MPHVKGYTQYPDFIAQPLAAATPVSAVIGLNGQTYLSVVSGCATPGVTIKIAAMTPAGVVTPPFLTVTDVAVGVLIAGLVQAQITVTSPAAQAGVIWAGTLA